MEMQQFIPRSKSECKTNFVTYSFSTKSFWQRKSFFDSKYMLSVTIINFSKLRIKLCEKGKIFLRMKIFRMEWPITRRNISLSISIMSNLYSYYVPSIPHFQLWDGEWNKKVAIINTDSRNLFGGICRKVVKLFLTLEFKI